MDQQTSEDIVKGWRGEILGYIKEMGKFREIDNPGYILRQLSGYSARATYINNLAAQSKNRQVSEFRYEELQPFLKETDFQFRIWSRIAALNADEWKMNGEQ